MSRRIGRSLLGSDKGTLHPLRTDVFALPGPAPLKHKAHGPAPNNRCAEDGVGDQLLHNIWQRQVPDWSTEWKQRLAIKNAPDPQPTSAAFRRVASAASDTLGTTEFLYRRFLEEPRMLAGGRVGSSVAVAQRPPGVLRFAVDDVAIREVLDIDEKPQPSAVPSPSTSQLVPQEVSADELTATTELSVADALRPRLRVDELAQTPFDILSEPHPETNEATAPDLFFESTIVRVRTFGSDATAVRNFVYSIVVKAHGDHRHVWSAYHRQPYMFPSPEVGVASSVAYNRGVLALWSLVLKNASASVLRRLIALQESPSGLIMPHRRKCVITEVIVLSEPTPVLLQEATTPSDPLCLPTVVPEGDARCADPLPPPPSVEENVPLVQLGNTDSCIAPAEAETEERPVVSTIPICVATDFDIIVRCPPSTVLGTVMRTMEETRREGFINYASVLRHGHPSTFSLRFARLLLQDRLQECVAAYARYFGDDDSTIASELRSLEHRVRGYVQLNNARLAQRNIARDWRDTSLVVQDALAEVLRHINRHDKAQASEFDTGVSDDHLRLLNDFMKSVTDANNDAERILSELVPERVLRDHLRTASDVCFNVLASLRVRKGGGMRVLPGDIVCTDRYMTWDANEPSLFGMCTSSTTDLPVEEYEFIELTHDSARSLHVVKDLEDARRFSPLDVMIPKVGFLAPPDASPHTVYLDVHQLSAAARAAFECIPFTADSIINPEIIGKAMKALKMERLATHPLAPPPTLRRLFGRCASLHICAWNDTMQVEFGDRDSDGNLVLPTVVDSDGVRHQLPFGASGDFVNHRRAVRSGIKGALPRAALLGGSKRQVVVGLKGRIPAGMSITSLLRETFELQDTRLRDMLRLARADRVQELTRQNQNRARRERNNRRRAERIAE